MMDSHSKLQFYDCFGQILRVCQEKVPGLGEDAWMSLVCEEGALIACLDGCGGIGSRRYASFDGHTGAYVASRVSAEVLADWFLAGCEQGISGLAEERLAEGIRQALLRCSRSSAAGSALKGSLAKEFPTTLAAAVAWAEGGTLQSAFYWAGDSRGYMLDSSGLHQITADDVEQQDAMKNLSEDGRLENVISASHRFRIHRRTLPVEKPEILITCTDGCFGYLDSPMAFELLLLETMQEAKSPAGWEAALRERIGRVAGDDDTLLAMVLGFSDFAEIKRCYAERFREMKIRREHAKSPDQLEEWWQSYRKEYGRYLTIQGQDKK